MRLALGVEYDGSDFKGWESQADERTVQACLEEALGEVADAPVATVCAGRTDAGVHACGQVVHFDTDAAREPRAWVMGTNTHLPGDVVVRWATPVDVEFHARFSARARRYRYVIENRPTRPAVTRRLAAWEYRALDADRMRAGADHLLGEHDFSAYRAAGCQARRPIRTILAIDVIRRGERVVVDVSANAFLQHMVRNIVGVLIDIGAGKREPRWAAEVLETRDRTRGGKTAPACGLSLVAVEYPASFGVPAVPPDGPLW